MKKPLGADSGADWASQQSNDDILKSFREFLKQPDVKKEEMKEELQRRMAEAFAQDHGDSWVTLFKFCVQHGLVTDVSFVQLNQCLKDAYKENKRKVFVDVLSLIKSYNHPHEPGCCTRECLDKDDVDKNFLKTVLDENVAVHAVHAVHAAHASVQLQEEDIAGWAKGLLAIRWMVAILTVYGRSFFPEYVKKLSANEDTIETAFDLYGEYKLKESYFDAEGSVLGLACQQNDIPMVRHWLSKNTDRPIVISYAFNLAVQLNRPEIAELLLAGGADLNYTDPSWEPAIFYAISNSQIRLVRMLVSNDKFDWNKKSSDGSVFYAACHQHQRSGSNQKKKDALEILTLLIENFPKDAYPAVPSILTFGRTALTYAIIKARECAAVLIEAGFGVFDLDGAKLSPLHHARQQHDRALEKQLNDYYARNVSTIVKLLISSDPRVCDESAHCSLVQPLVNDWLDLRKELFEELKEIVEDSTTSLKDLKKIKKQLENPRSTFSQFFKLGYGDRFWQPSSPWPRQFASLIWSIEDKFLASTCLIESPSPKGYGSQSGDTSQ